MVKMIFKCWQELVEVVGEGGMVVVMADGCKAARGMIVLSSHQFLSCYTVFQSDVLSHTPSDDSLCACVHVCVCVCAHTCVRVRACMCASV